MLTLLTRWDTLRSICRIIYQLRVQKIFLKKKILPLLDTYRTQNDGSLEEKDFKKITHYYGLAVPAILGAAFCALHGKTMNEKERWASTCQGAMTGLFDDFFDKHHMSDEWVKALMQGKNSRKGAPQHEQLFDHFYSNVLNNAPDVALVQKSLRDVYTAQVASKKQSLSSITPAEITAITFEKGGHSLVFYRSVFLPFASDHETNLLYQFGGLMQLSNDIFDVYKDRESGVKTLVTEARNIKEIRQLVRQQWLEQSKNAQQYGQPLPRVHRFLKILSLAIFSRAMVCLDQLESLQTNTDGLFRVEQYSRKQLICDMEKWGNLRRAAQYHQSLMHQAQTAKPELSQ